jgi:hypothetical protein
MDRGLVNIGKLEVSITSSVPNLNKGVVLDEFYEFCEKYDLLDASCKLIFYQNQKEGNIVGCRISILNDSGNLFNFGSGYDEYVAIKDCLYMLETQIIEKENLLEEMNYQAKV